VVHRTVDWLRAEAAFVLVLVLLFAACGYLYLQPDHWRRGTGLIAGAMLVAGALRLALPHSRVGLLHVRGRWRDGLTYLVIGGLILGVAIHLK
jgi:hypothetical protein